MLRLKCNNKERIIMDKKNYLIIWGTMLVFIIAIVAILLSGKNNSDWTTDIKEAQNYQMIITDCNDRQKELDKSTLNTLSDKWDVLSNNGPWTGDTTACYTTLTISYDTNGIVKQKNIIIIDESTLVLDVDANTIYYTNASEIINYLNSLFVKQ